MAENTRAPRKSTKKAKPEEPPRSLEDRAVETASVARWVPIDTLQPWVKNPRKNDEAAVKVAASIKRFGFIAPVVIWTRPDNSQRLVAGHTRLKAMALLLREDPRFVPKHAPGPGVVPVFDGQFADEAEADAYALADNRLGELAEWDDKGLAEVIQELQGSFDDLSVMGWDQAALERIGAGQGGEDPHQSMSEMFGVPPFTLLDSRQGYWKTRKGEWLSLGLASGQGREEMVTTINKGDTDWVHRGAKEGGSIFDPVLAEILLRWFCPTDGSVLDPFAGGSVRGVVSAALGNPYTGIDVRAEQVTANIDQWKEIGLRVEGAFGGKRKDAMPQQTPIEVVEDIWMKRDDGFVFGGVAGGKVRTCWFLAQGATGLVTAGHRSSPQVNIVAHVAKAMGVPCRVHVPSGNLSPEVQAAQAAGAEVVQHKPGWSSVLIARAREDAKARDWTEIPFGMECQEAISQTRQQVDQLPEGVQRIVMPVGSGMSLAGVLWGLLDTKQQVKVVGIVVGADPVERLDQYAPPHWRELVELVPAGTPYEKPAKVSKLHGVQLDPHYEAKCIPFVKPGDLFWVVGIRQTMDAQRVVDRKVPAPKWICGDSQKLAKLLPKGEQYDFILSCPPYGDLEVYSQQPQDISRLDYEAFLPAYREIIRLAVGRLKANRFAAWVVGDFRDARGAFRNFVGDTIHAFLQADSTVCLYNQAILVTPCGSLPLRTGRAFQAARKLGKTHQDVLVFYKGDPTPENIRTALGNLRASVPLPEAEAE